MKGRAKTSLPQSITSWVAGDVGDADTAAADIAVAPITGEKPAIMATGGVLDVEILGAKRQNRTT